MRTRRFLVIHHTCGGTAESSIEWWKNPEANGACAHFVIDRDGTVYQCRPCNVTAGHAGKSQWTDPNTGKVYTGLNSCSIGIELANAGDCANDDGTAFRSQRNPAGFPLPAGVRRMRHKNGGPVTAWEVYPDVQLLACEVLARELVARYNLDDVMGHEDISPGRKVDPGPCFPMTSFRGKLGFRDVLPKWLMP